MFGRRSACATHHDALLEFADRHVRGPEMAAALDHLEVCRDCEAELSEIMLALVGLRRIHDEVAKAEPPTDAWLRLRTRIERRRKSPWLIRSPLPGLMMAMSLITAVGIAELQMPAVPRASELGATSSPSGRDAYEPRIIQVPGGDSPGELVDRPSFNRRVPVDGDGSKVDVAAADVSHDTAVNRRVRGR